MENIKELFQTGATTSRIAAILKIHPKKVKEYIKENNLTLKLEEFTIENYEKIINLYKMGISVKSLEKKYNTTHRQINNLLKKNNLNLRKAKEAKILIERNLDIFTNLNDPETVYWLGFLFADGCNATKSIKVGLAIEDIEHVKKFSKYLFKDQYEQKVTTRNIKLNGKEFGIAEVAIHSVDLCKKLQEIGLVPRKSLILTFPNWINNDNFPHFLRGYFDGDGSFGMYGEYDKAPMFSILGTKEFLESIKSYFPNIHTSMSQKNKLKNTYTLGCYNFKHIKYILDLMYKNCGDLKLNRKYETYLEFCNREKDILAIEDKREKDIQLIKKYKSENKTIYRVAKLIDRSSKFVKKYWN